MCGDSFVSQKLKHAKPVQIHGRTWGSEGGKLLDRVVNSNLMVVGDSAGFNSIIHAIATGKYAGEIAATAVIEGDTTESSLMRYVELFRQKGIHKTTLSWSKGWASFRGHTDREMESMIPELLMRDEIKYRDAWDF